MKAYAFAVIIIFTAFSCGSDSKKHTIPDKAENNDEMEQGQEKLRSLIVTGKQIGRAHV